MEFGYIQQILAGNDSYFTYFLDTYKHMAYSVAFSITDNKEDAEDAVQEAFVKAYRSLAKFRQEAKFSTWFYKIVVNTALTKVKRHKIYSEVAVEELSDTLIESTDLAYKKLATEEQRQYIDLAMAKLNPEDRLILTLYYLNENSLEEITEITAIKPENLKMKLHRARKKMYAILNKLLLSETHTIV
ncbi:MAG: sigma-70 family RNA polymerase sigma factor [Bacteroidota bacterium]|nr:sigma-70 family RNA polymerase sigma factor [Bacteroidota bacterium]